jgi:cellulose synthase/poly-beta-1,6-N-acetylglucosamine synthase-like glycosyltransferase
MTAMLFIKALSWLFYFIVVAFWVIMFYYTILGIFGIIYKVETMEQEPNIPSYFPSVAVFIPAHNEEVVIFETLDAMASLEYEGPMNIYLLNDNSTDRTGDIADFWANIFVNIHHVKVPPGEPKGKSRVLNYGRHISYEEVIAVYDADNRPNPDAVKLLVYKLMENEKYGGVAGYYRSYNMYKTILTTMIGLESLLYQLTMQSGRWKLLKLGSFPGTNMMIKRHVLDEIGGWDEYALAEDAEQSLALTARGYLIAIEPRSQSWEQEPEKFSVWFRQRTRWMIGNLYLVQKTIATKEYRSGRNLWNAIQLISVYYVFFTFVILSDIWFVLGLLGIFSAGTHLPLLTLWFESWWIYATQLIVAAFLEGELTPKNIIIATIMYFTYAQAWLVILANAWIQQWKARRKGHTIKWDKTPRF